MWLDNRRGRTRARERILHIFSSLPPIAKVHDIQLGITLLPRCYTLLAVTPPPPPPPPIFGRNYCIGLFYLHYTPPPLRAARAGLRYCSSCTCTRVASVEELYSCIKRVENSLRKLVLAFFTDLGRFPEAVILPMRPVGGVWLRDTLQKKLQRTYVAFSTAKACRSKEFSSSASQQSFIDLSTRIRGGGGLNCEAKAQVLVMPSPLFFLEVGCKKGGRNSGAVRCSQMDNVLLLNSGGSVVQLDTTDSGPRPHVSPLRI